MNFKMSYNEDEINRKNEENGEEILKKLEEVKYMAKVKTIIIVIIAVLITFCLTILFYGEYLAKKGIVTVAKEVEINYYPETNNVVDSFNKIRTILDDYYKGEVPDNATLEQAAIKGYVEGYGDPYTEFLTEEEWKELNESLSDFVGIGVYLSEKKNSNQTIVLAPTSDESPAAKAGMKAGDIIYEINSENVLDKGAEYVSSKVRGEEGTNVKIKVLRESGEVEFDIKREKIKQYEIKHEMLDGNIGYIDFNSFTEDSYNEFKAAIDDIKSKNPKGLIIDLRDNTGGYVDAALKIADLFTDKDTKLLITEDKNGNKVTEVAKQDKEVSMPTVILVNNYSASASEILTGIFKDYQLATIVGTKTYGKGVIQAVLTSDRIRMGGAALKVTIEEYFTPNGNAINKIGITPDVEIELETDLSNLTKDTDNQLQKALEILKNN